MDLVDRCVVRWIGGRSVHGSGGAVVDRWIVAGSAASLLPCLFCVQLVLIQHLADDNVYSS